MRGKRRVAAIVGGVLVALVVVFAALLAFVDSDVVVARVKDYVLPKVSERIGRQVTIETARAKLFPNPHVTLQGLVVHGLEDEPPLIEAAQADVDLKLWPLIRSFGKDIEIDRFTLQKPEINLLRKADGTWNYEGMGGSSSPSNREYSVSTARVKNGLVRIIDRSSPRGEATVALTNIDAVLSNFGEGQPLSLKGAAAFASSKQNLKMNLTTSPLVSGKVPGVNGQFTLDGAELPRLEGLLPAKLATITTGGLIGMNAHVTSKGDVYRVEGDANLSQLQLRGQPANGSFHVVASAKPNDLNSLEATLTKVSLKGPGVDLTGNAHGTLQPKQAQFALQGPLLDLDTLLGVMPQHAEAQTPNRTAMLPAAVRNQINQIDLRGTLKIGKVVNGKLTAENLDAVAVLENGVLRLEKAAANFYGGQVDASGTTAILTQKFPNWNLNARLANVNLGSAMQTLSGVAPVQGKLDVSLNVKGEGADWPHIRQTLTGTGAMALRDGELTSADLGQNLANALAQGLKAMGKPGVAGTLQKAAGKTELKNLNTGFTIQNGALVLREPLTFASPFGGGRLDGKIGLDQSLALNGTVVLSQPFLAQTIGKSGFTPPAPVSVPVQIGGTLKAPTISANPAQIAQSVVKGQVNAGAQQLEQEVQRQARKQLGNIFQRLGGP